MRKRHNKSFTLSLVRVLIVFFFSTNVKCQNVELDSWKYISAVSFFANKVIRHGRDRYGIKRTPLFADGLHVESLNPPSWKGTPEKTWIISNFASQQALMRILDSLSILTGDQQYKRIAEEVTQYVLSRLRTPNGLLYWGGHIAWDLIEDLPVGDPTFTHELKTHQPYFQLMWRVNPVATQEILERFWAGHITDWSHLDYDRHAATQVPLPINWNHKFSENINVPFQNKINNLSFANVMPPFIHSGITLAVLGKNNEAFTWTYRLVYRWQQMKDKQSGLSGGQLSFWENDRARPVLGHIHPTINESNIVAGYHRIGRYHYLPLAQIQAGETLVKIGGEYSKTGQEFIKWASDDLKIYTQNCYDRNSGMFVSRMTNGTLLKEENCKKGYYPPGEFAPKKPEGWIFWGLSMAYRLTQDYSHWQILRKIGINFNLGDIGKENGQERSLSLSTTNKDWRVIYSVLELYKATNDPNFLHSACRIADNLLATQTRTGLFPLEGWEYARTGDEIPLAILHLAAEIDGKHSLLPQAVLDNGFFINPYYGAMKNDKRKQKNSNVYDNRLFYGRY